MLEADVNFMYMIDEIMRDGVEVNTRNSLTKRLRNLQTTYTQAPLVTIRRTAWRNAIREMEWFLSGSNNINDLHEKVRHWWEPWANESGFIHNNYSKQLRQFDGAQHQGGVRQLDKNGTDQIAYLMDAIKNHPFSRRSVITTWHTHDMVSPVTPITNCHGTVIQAFVEPDNSLHLTMYQRSSDMVLGLPHNLIQYWALLMYLAYHGGRDVGSFTWIGGDCHVYKEHYELAEEMSLALFGHQASGQINKPPKLIYTPTSEDFKAEDFSLDSKYEPILKKSAKMIV